MRDRTAIRLREENIRRADIASPPAGPEHPRTRKGVNSGDHGRTTIPGNPVKPDPEELKAARRLRRREARERAGKPEGMTWRDHKLYSQSRLMPLEKKLAADKFEADIKAHGMTEALRMHGIEEDV